MLVWLMMFRKQVHINIDRAIKEILMYRYEDFARLRHNLVDMGYLRQ